MSWHLHVSLRVPPHRVEELLDRIWRIAETHGTLAITGLIDEYREDVYIEFTETKERRNGRTPQDRTPHAEGHPRSGSRGWD